MIRLPGPARGGVVSMDIIAALMHPGDKGGTASCG